MRQAEFIALAAAFREMALKLRQNAKAQEPA
jgi:hypothetical protein